MKQTIREKNIVRSEYSGFESSKDGSASKTITSRKLIYYGNERDNKEFFPNGIKNDETTTIIKYINGDINKIGGIFEEVTEVHSNAPSYSFTALENSSVRYTFHPKSSLENEISQSFIHQSCKSVFKTISEGEFILLSSSVNNINGVSITFENIYDESNLKTASIEEDSDCRVEKFYNKDGHCIRIITTTKRNKTKHITEFLRDSQNNIVYTNENGSISNIDNEYYNDTLIKSSYVEDGIFHTHLYNSRGFLLKEMVCDLNGKNKDMQTILEISYDENDNKIREKKYDPVWNICEINTWETSKDGEDEAREIDGILYVGGETRSFERTVIKDGVEDERERFEAIDFYDNHGNLIITVSRRGMAEVETIIRKYDEKNRIVSANTSKSIKGKRKETLSISSVYKYTDTMSEELTTWYTDDGEQILQTFECKRVKDADGRITLDEQIISYYNIIREEDRK